MSTVGDSSHGPSVYVVVLNWNGWRDTIQCLHALRYCAYKPLSIVVVDNGSTDDSVEQIKGANPDVTFIEIGQNRGFAGGNNPGIRYAMEQNADYIWLLNNDTEPERDALTHLVRIAQRDPGIGAVGSVLLSPDHRTVLAWGGGRVNRWIGYSKHAISPKTDTWFHYITAASMLVPRRTFEQVGLLDDRYFLYWEDSEFGFRLRKHGWKLAVSPDSRVVHKENGSTGGNRSALTRYSTASAMRFLSDYSPLSRLSPLLFLTLRFGRRLLTGRLREVHAVIRGSKDFSSGQASIDRASRS